MATSGAWTRTRCASAVCCRRRSRRASRGWPTSQSVRVAAVEVEAAQAVEFVEEVVAEALGLIEDDERDDAVLVDEGDERGLDVADDLGPRAWSEA